MLNSSLNVCTHTHTHTHCCVCPAPCNHACCHVRLQDKDMPKSKGLPIKTMEGEFMYVHDEEDNKKQRKGPSRVRPLPASDVPKVRFH
jgi:hypothetical protein